MKQFRNSRIWVSEDGEIWKHYPERIINNPTKNTLKSGEIRIYNTPKIRPEKWKQLNPCISNNDYYTTTLKIDEVKYHLLIHRIVAEVYCSGYFEGAHVDHIDNNKLNNHYTNLQWCTQEYNQEKRDKINYPPYNVRHK